ncbi:MAG: helix-turn-helix transcriptional regulator [Gammaproteobacteria bacterium]|nr:helix-turn-helix transcriptional regulator [Gammaproteobacteria bacterium]
MEHASSHESTGPFLGNEFGQHLKHWRNTRRYSQLQLAVEADISQRHISFLESGRSQPSRDMVLRLAETLELPLKEQNEMLSRGGYAPIFQARSLESDDMTSVKAALRMQLDHHDPYPAVVIDQAWNVLMTNKGMDTLLALGGDADEMWQEICGDGPRNILKLTLHPAGLRRFTSDWKTVALVTLQRLRREARALQSEELQNLLEELLALPGVPDDWKAAVSDGTPAPLLPMSLQAGGLAMNLMSMLASFGTPQDVTVADLRIELFYPADEPSADLLKMLAAATP